MIIASARISPDVTSRHYHLHHALSPQDQSLKVNMSDSTVFCQMYIQPIFVVSSFHSEKPPREYEPIGLVILRHHTAMLNDPMLLRQILLGEALNVGQSTTASTAHTSGQKANRSIGIAIGKLLPYELVHPVFLLVIAVGPA